MSNEINPVAAHSARSTFSEPAEVRLVSQSLWAQSDYKVAYVLVSSRIYWKVANEDGTNKPKSLLDFRNAESFELVRLDDAIWDDVGEYVKVDECNGRTRITVSRRPRERKRRKCAALVHEPQLEILPSTHEQQEEWVNQIRARIAPWNLLQQEVTDVANSARTSGVMELRNARNGLVTSSRATEPSSLPANARRRKWSDFLGTLPEMMAKLSTVDKLTAQGAGTVGSGVAMATLLARIEHVAETAKVIGDATKFAAGLSSIFQLVALGAQGASMWATSIHGQTVLPIALGRIEVLLKYVLESVTGIMKPSRDANEIDIEFVFEALRQTVCTMDLAETQLMRGRVGQIFNAEDVKEVERKLEELRPMAVIAGNILKICAVDEKVQQSKVGQEIWCDEPHHVRPSLSAFFSGRARELDALRAILDKWGSAVITQYGGVGKTELMIAFAAQAEKGGAVPGGVFWVTIGGGERDVIESLARLAEKLIRRKMREEDRRNPNLVVAWLKRGLDERRGRWLLCLDNADNSEVNGILNEVCGIAGRMSGDGWVIVTSRQGQPHLWSEMRSEQKLVLEPLRVKDAMVSLWRETRKITTRDGDDVAVMNAIDVLEVADAEEYRALKELCGDEGGCSLGGLPLALVQAGAYIARYKCSFAEYRNMFKDANRMEDMQGILRSTEKVRPIRESQKSIWTTWKISVRRLSEKAYTVLRSMAMLGSCGVEGAILMKILEGLAAEEKRSIEWVFREVVIEELVHGSSLISRDEGERDGEERSVYRMHRLVQLFIVSDMKHGSAVWNRVYTLALISVHDAVENELGREGKSFAHLPDVFGSKHRETVIHATAIVDRHILPAQGEDISHFSEVEDLHYYIGELMEFMSNPEEEVRVWQRLLNILCHRQVVNRKKGCIGRLLDMKHSRSREKELSSRIAAVYNSLGSALQRNGKLSEAASKHQESLKMKLEIHGPNTPHSAIASSLNNLGSVYEDQGKLDKALEKYEQSLKMQLEIHGPNTPHSDIASSLNNLGLLYQAQGKLDKALEKYEQSLKMQLEIHGPNTPHSAIASSLNNLGSVYEAQGKLDKALEKYEQSLKMDLEIHGPNTPHSAIAVSLWNVGKVYFEKKNLGQAAEFLERSLEMLRTVHARNLKHPHITLLLSNLADVYEEQGRTDEARAIRDRNADTDKR